MKIIHIIHGKANPNSANGISRVVYYLNKYEKLSGVDSQIWALVDGIKEHCSYKRDEFVTVECFPRVRTFGNREIIKALTKERHSIDLIHFHLIWFYDKNIIAKELKKLGIPFIITTHGTYSNPHAYTGKRLLAKWLFELKYLKMANECHILTPEEGTGLKKYGYKGRCFIAPNGFEKKDLPTCVNYQFFKDYNFKDRLILSMVAVLREDKNIDLILYAISMLPKELQNKLVFVLIGPDYKGNALKYQALAQRLDVKDSFCWIGPLYEKDKYDAMFSSDGYIMASNSEGFSMSIIDAMACRLPMILTSGCNMKYLSDEKFYIMCEPYAQDINRAINEFYVMGERRKLLGHKAYEVMEKTLYWENIIPIMIKNYERIIKEAHDGRHF